MKEVKEEEITFTIHALEFEIPKMTSLAFDLRDSKAPEEVKQALRAEIAQRQTFIRRLRGGDLEDLNHPTVILAVDWYTFELAHKIDSGDFLTRSFKYRAAQRRRG